MTRHQVAISFLLTYIFAPVPDFPQDPSLGLVAFLVLCAVAFLLLCGGSAGYASGPSLNLAYYALAYVALTAIAIKFLSGEGGYPRVAFIFILILFVVGGLVGVWLHEMQRQTKRTGLRGLGDAFREGARRALGTHRVHPQRRL